MTLTSIRLPPRKLRFPPDLNFIAPVELGDLIRVGGQSDGGYVIPSMLVEKTDILISFGISKDWSFEANFLSLRPGLQIHAYDHTISRAYFMRHAWRSVDGRLFKKSGIRELRKRVRLALDYPRFFSGNVKHYQQRIHNRKDLDLDATIEDVLARTNSEKIFIKMDIEGSEYRVISDLLKYSSRILGMVIEFHDTDPLRKTFVSSVKNLMEKYEIAHIHGNNFGYVSIDNVPESMEITFIRKEFAFYNGRRTKLPIPGLDRPNSPTNPDFCIFF